MIKWLRTGFNKEVWEMINRYFEIKVKEPDFEEHVLEVSEKLKGKDVIIYGTEEFKLLNKKYKFNQKFNIVALTDSKNKIKGKFMSFRTIAPSQVKQENFEAILITDTNSVKVKKYLEYDLLIDNEKIETIFNENFKDESENLNYLYKLHFDKSLPKLIKKLKNKTVVLYGAGAFLELIKNYFDISEMNIVGISDKRFEEHECNETFLGYRVFSPNEITKLNPNYVIVTTKRYVNIIENLYYELLKGTKIKIKPLVKKGFIELLKEF